jgi:hypothetical protein
MIKLPVNSKWSQPNSSDKFGSLAYTKNINLDEEGYIKLSPRSVALFDDTADTSNISDTDFNFPVAFGRYQEGSMRIATTDEPFNLTVTNSSKTIAEDAGSNNPNLTFNSHGVWWQNRFYESTDTAVNYNTGGTWTANAITGLSSSYRHALAVFRNRKTLCVSNGNVLKQYDTSHASSTDLTIPSDYEIVGLAYNNYRMGIITRLGTDSAGQNAECFFFSWDGATTEANQGVSLGAYSSVAIVPYKSSFVVITSSGEWLYWNGGGFDKMAQFPFYLSEARWGDLLNYLSYGDNLVIDGDVIYANVGFDLTGIGRKDEEYLPNNPSGVWCYDPQVGLYHRYSPSLSKAYFHNITEANVNTTTNVFTTSVTIPATGNPAILTSDAVGGLTLGIVYYVIKTASTTFQLAETKELALAGVAIDITSASANQYFWMYDIVDYGASYSSKAGAVALWGTSTRAYRDVIYGGRYLDSALTSQISLCSAVPFLESRGYFVTPKIYSDQVKDSQQKIFCKHRPLNTNDKIIFKVKTRERLGLPVTSATSGSFIWTSDNEGYTTFDLSEAKTAFDSGDELEIEFIAGMGAGQMVKITSIEEEDGTYALILEESVVGAAASLKSHFVIDMWKKVGEVNYTNQTLDGVLTILVSQTGKWSQHKVELRGYETTIEELLIINSTHQKAQ